MAEVARYLGINPATLTRKMDGTSDFTRSEIQLLRTYLSLSDESLNAIFLRMDLRKRKKEWEDNMISLDNGNTWLTAEEAMPEIQEKGLWDAIVAMMDDEVRESEARDMAPCTEEDFLEEYLNRAGYLVIG